MKAGIIGAMEQEVTLLRDKINNLRTHKVAGCEIYTGMLNGISVALLKSGIGKVSAAMGTALLLELHQPDFIINTGSAGGLDPTLNPGDIVVSDEVGYHDVDLTIFGYAPGQMAGCPALFKADKQLVSSAQDTITQLSLHTVQGLVVCGDAFINGAEPLARIRHTFPNAIALEMEGAAIAHVCHQFDVPFVVIRSISDVADKKAHLSFDQFLETASRNSSLVVETLLTNLQRG